MTRRQRERKSPVLRRHSELTAEMNNLLATGQGGAKLRGIFKKLNELRNTADWRNRPPLWNGCP